MISWANVSNNGYRLFWSSEPIVTKGDNMVKVYDTILTHTGLAKVEAADVSGKSEAHFQPRYHPPRGANYRSESSLNMVHPLPTLLLGNR